MRSSECKETAPNKGSNAVSLDKILLPKNLDTALKIAIIRPIERSGLTPGLNVQCTTYCGGVA